jgi:hypothetical protein
MYTGIQYNLQIEWDNVWIFAFNLVSIYGLTLDCSKHRFRLALLLLFCFQLVQKANIIMSPACDIIHLIDPILLDIHSCCRLFRFGCIRRSMCVRNEG